MTPKAATKQIRAATSLDELHSLLTGSVGRELPEREWTRLPTFGGDEPASTSEIWSWDETRLLVGTCEDDLKIEPRPVAPGIAREWVGQMSEDDKAAIREAGNADAWREGISDHTDDLSREDLDATIAEIERLVVRGAACSAQMCARPVYAHGLCEPHDRRERRGSTSTAPVRPRGTEPLRALSLRVPESVYSALGAEPATVARRVLEEWARSR